MLTFHEFINESKQVGKLYHFTHLNGLTKLIDINFLFKSPNGYVSTTRDYNFPNNPLNDFNPKRYIVRITLDGNKISHNYKVTPINGLDSNDKEIFGTHKNDERVPHKSEMEEVITMSGDTFDLKPYIIKIEVLNTPEGIKLADDIKDKYSKLILVDRFSRW